MMAPKLIIMIKPASLLLVVVVSAISHSKLLHAEGVPSDNAWCSSGLFVYSVPLEDVEGKKHPSLAPSHGQIGSVPVSPNPLFVLRKEMVSRATVSTQRSQSGQVAHSATLLIDKSEAMQLAAIIDSGTPAPFVVASCERGKFFGIVSFPFPFRQHVQLFGGAYVDISVSTEELAAKTVRAFSAHPVKDRKLTGKATRDLRS